MHTHNRSYSLQLLLKFSQSKVMYAKFRRQHLGVNSCVNIKNRARYILRKGDSLFIIFVFPPTSSPNFSENTLNI